MGTMSSGSIYPGRPSTQETVNPANSQGSAKIPTRSDFDIPVLPSLAGFWGISVPMLIVLGVLAFYLIEKYD